MDQWTEIRKRVLVQGESKRSIIRETGMHWKTLEKMLTHSQPPGYRKSKPRIRTKIGPFEKRIQTILQEDLKLPGKQRHTAKRLWERLQDEEGYTGGYTAVKEVVRQIQLKSQEVFMPLKHIPGEAQVDFGFALARIANRLCKVPFFVMTLPYSDAVFVAAFPRECTETFWEGHLRAFEFFRGVPSRITYDNSRIAVSNIIGVTGRKRKLTDGFLQLQSHYLFDHHFCRVRRANEKGVVEGLVKYSRLNFMVPVPQVRDFEQLNGMLLKRCQEDLSRQLRGKKTSKSLLLEDDQAAMLAIPSGCFDATRKVSTTASSLSLVRFDRNDYSVPVCWAHHPVQVKGGYQHVTCTVQGREVARHERIWEKEQICFDPIHYLALLERKPGALDYALPMDDLDLPECFGILRRRLENQQAGEGTREYIRVLRLLEKHSIPVLQRAVEKSLEHGALTRDAVAQFLYPREQGPHPIFKLEGHPHLKEITVQAPDLYAYNQLMGEAI